MREKRRNKKEQIEKNMCMRYQIDGLADTDFILK